MPQTVKQEIDLEELITNINKAEERLSNIAAHEHPFIYELVNGLSKNIAKSSIGIGEDKYIPEILNYTDLAMTHILHVSNKNEFLRGYYEKFIRGKTEEFEARLGYVDSLVQLAIALDAFNGSNIFSDFKINQGLSRK